MKVIHLTLAAGGGAGIAASRGVRALRDHGVDAELWTAAGGDLGPALRSRWWARARTFLDGTPKRFYRRRRFFSAWSNGWLPSQLASRVNRARPDIVHLHWIGGGFLSLEELPRFKAPVVWTMHDAWSFTGGCHYPDQCERFAQACGACPQLGSTHDRDLSWRNLRTKHAQLARVAAFVAPSAWLAGLAMRSGKLPAHDLSVIPYALDGKIFCPRNQQDARRDLGLPDNALVLATGALDLKEPRKGYHLLHDAIARLVTLISRPCVLLIFGANGQAGAHHWPCEVRWLGKLHEEQEVARLYNAADAVLMPSLQDNLPNLALEAQACGCPVVGFDTGGLREIIEIGQTGLLTQKTDSVALANAVAEWCAMALPRQLVQVRCRDRFETTFTSSLHAERLGRLYSRLISD